METVDVGQPPLQRPVPDRGLAVIEAGDVADPHVVRDAVTRWEADGATLSVLAGRFRVLRSAIGWAYDERIIDHHPIRTMRGPGRAEPRRPLPDADVTALLATASTRLLEAVANDTGEASTWRRHVAEQDLLLVRLAADTCARRG